MSKDEWLWLAIRIAGIYFLVLAVVAVPAALGALYSFAQIGVGPESGGAASHLAAVKKAALGQGVKAIAEVVMFLIASVYMLRGGRLIHRLASREEAR